MSAINVLRASVWKAESKGRERMDFSHLPETLQAFENPGKLNIDELLLLDILREKEKLPSCELFAQYRQIASNPKGERFFRKYMEKLCSKGLVKAKGENRWRRYEMVQ